MNLDQIVLKCVEIAKIKGFNNEPRWLERCMFKELGELIQCVEDKEVKKKEIHEDEVALEFIDYIVFSTQYIALYIPKINLNKTMHEEILKTETYGGDLVDMNLTDIKDLCYNHVVENQISYNAIDLEIKMFRSVADLIEAVEKKNNNEDIDDEQIAICYCWTIYYGCLYLHLKTTFSRLDRLFDSKVNEILNSKKKTLEGDRIVEK